MEAKSEDPLLEFPTEKVRSNDFTSLMLLLGKSNFCLRAARAARLWEAKGWASDLGLVPDHSNPG